MAYVKGSVKNKLNTSVRKRMKDISEDLKREADEIAPLNTGALRDSGKTTDTAKGFIISYGNSEVKYADVRYKLNNKNPQTTKWIEKAYNKRKGTYKEWLEQVK